MGYDGLHNGSSLTKAKRSNRDTTHMKETWKVRQDWLRSLFALGAMVPSVLRAAADAEDVARAVARVDEAGDKLRRTKTPKDKETSSHE